jgi:hypothetical protein
MRYEQTNYFIGNTTNNCIISLELLQLLYLSMYLRAN